MNRKTKEIQDINRYYKAKGRYVGYTAQNYNRKRIRAQKWKKEQEVFGNILVSIPSSSIILDIPIGTGRFIPFYKEYGLEVHGVDISEDMLNEARIEAIANKFDINLSRADAERLPQRDSTFDYVICARLLNWLPLNIFDIMLREFIRVTRKGLLLEVRVAYPLKKAELRKFSTFWHKKLSLNQQKGFFLHEAKSIQKLFDKYNLEIIEGHIVEKGINIGNLSLTHLVVYHLKRKKLNVNMVDNSQSKRIRNDTKKKVYIITSPCSGKTYFVKKCNGTYKGLGIIDFEDIIRNRFVTRKILGLSLNERIREYNEIIIQFLQNHMDSICVLGSLGPDNPYSYKNITFIAVLIPEKKAILYCNARRKRLFRWFDHWAVWSNVEKFRSEIITYSRKNQIPIYESITSALNNLRIKT